jgi:hypothetical protein
MAKIEVIAKRTLTMFGMTVYVLGAGYARVSSA